METLLEILTSARDEAVAELPVRLYENGGWHRRHLRSALEWIQSNSLNLRDKLVDERRQPVVFRQGDLLDAYPLLLQSELEELLAYVFTARDH